MGAPLRTRLIRREGRTEGRYHLWPNKVWPRRFTKFGQMLFSRLGGGLAVRAVRVGGPKFRAFLLPRHNFLSFFPLLEVFSLNFVVGLKTGALCTFGLSCCHVKPRRPRHSGVVLGGRSWEKKHEKQQKLVQIKKQCWSQGGWLAVIVGL